MKLHYWPLRSTDYHKNVDRGMNSRYGHCILCGRAINPKRAIPFHEVEGGGQIATPEESWDGDGDMGTQYIGRDCYKKHEAVLAEYRADID